MTKANEDTLDPITNDDALAESPREDVDPVPDTVGCDRKPTRKRKPAVKRKAKADGA